MVRSLTRPQDSEIPPSPYCTARLRVHNSHCLSTLSLISFSPSSIIPCLSTVISGSFFVCHPLPGSSLIPCVAHPSSLVCHLLPGSRLPHPLPVIPCQAHPLPVNWVPHEDNESGKGKGFMQVLSQSCIRAFGHRGAPDKCEHTYKTHTKTGTDVTSESPSLWPYIRGPRTDMKANPPVLPGNTYKRL